MKEQIEKLEMAIFILECKDRWNSKDYAEYDRLCKELRELKPQETAKTEYKETTAKFYVTNPKRKYDSYMVEIKLEDMEKFLKNIESMGKIAEKV